jgi:hypothetical protein
MDHATPRANGAMNMARATTFVRGAVGTVSLRIESTGICGSFLLV